MTLRLILLFILGQQRRNNGDGDEHFRLLTEMNAGKTSLIMIRRAIGK